MKKTLWIAGIATLAAAPLIAQDMKGHEGHNMSAQPAPMTRADIQACINARFAETDADKDGAIT